ncbi:hypothetical protein BKA63DRAFT_603011 [Paraphoma chrysanthemicola]|nr:hypothetical protein BKA63DRAFT_603011 [Paraphoma chrysanthemicola]
MMHKLQMLHLLLYINTLCYSSFGSAADIAAIPQILPESFTPFGDFEVVSVRQVGDEDIVQIRRRATEQDCETDCMTYTSWTDSGVHQCDDPAEDAVMPEKRSRLEKRRKDSKICEDALFTKDPKDIMSGFNIYSPNWPNPTESEKRNKAVYDTGDPAKPLEPEWFQLKSHEKRWKANPGKNGNRCYDTEHVLEWQMLGQFLQEDKEKGADSRCAFLYKYFVQKRMELKTYKVKAAKDKGKLTSKNRFDYEEVDYLFSKYDNKAQVDARVIDWIGFQWPGKGTSQSKPPNPWEYEAVVLYKDVNIKKENVWEGLTLFPEPKTDKNQESSYSLEWAFNNDYFDGTSKKKWPDNKGTCKAVHMFTTLMAVVQYHNDPFIREVMRAQVTRVGDAFAFLEDEVLVNEQWEHPVTKQIEKFKPRDLRKEWFDWMKKVHKERLDKLTKALADKISVFESKPGTKSRLKRWDYSGVFRRAVEEPNCGFEKDDQEMKKRVKLLVDAYKSMKPVDSELRLD